MCLHSRLHPFPVRRCKDVASERAFSRVKASTLAGAAVGVYVRTADLGGRHFALFDSQPDMLGFLDNVSRFFPVPLMDETAAVFLRDTLTKMRLIALREPGTRAAALDMRLHVLGDSPFHTGYPGDEQVRSCTVPPFAYP